ncbi:hypothetical protein HG530_001556 [Fusarium avenaceum]|nr:hypothetical protein HG530_001556 [Fusarium avenaceum]
MELKTSLFMIRDEEAEVHFLFPIQPKSRTIRLNSDRRIEVIQRQLLALLVSRSPRPIDIRPWLSLQRLGSLFKLSRRGPVAAIVVPTNNLPFRRISAGNVDFELQTGGQNGLGKEFTRMSRVELVPLIDPVSMVDQWITACDQEIVVFSTRGGLLIISLEFACHRNSEYLHH